MIYLFQRRSKRLQTKHLKGSSSLQYFNITFLTSNFRFSVMIYTDAASSNLLSKRGLSFGEQGIQRKISLCYGFMLYWSKSNYAQKRKFLCSLHSARFQISQTLQICGRPKPKIKNEKNKKKEKVGRQSRQGKKIFSSKVT